MLSQVHHSIYGTQEGILCIHALLCELLLHCAQQSTAAMCTAICCCIAHGNLLLRYTWQSAAVLCMAICCVTRSDVSRAADGTGHGDAMDVHSGMQHCVYTVLAPTKSPTSVKL